MHVSADEMAEWSSRDRLLKHLGRMVESRRLTPGEAERLCAARGPGEFFTAVRDVRVRHAATRLRGTAAGGCLTWEKADAFLQRLRSGDHAGSPRVELYEIRTGANSPGHVAPSQNLGDRPAQPAATAGGQTGA